MSKTLFWYVFRDLLRIFWMASGALAGIMSFGGLLRPLTEHGLDATQVSKMLTYFTPAMTTYSFPVAALFATTMVYGRLSADNELTACRSSGISYLSMTTPALVLGLAVSLVSLLFLCFIVPVFTLKVEKVVYSNLAQLVQNEIERTHQIKMDQLNVYAQSARVMPQDPAFPRDQRVELIGPMIVSYTQIDRPNNTHLRVPSEFYMAERAIAYIRQVGDEVYLEALLENGSKFPRIISGGIHMLVGTTQFGPVPFPSPIKEDAKFMTIDQLKDLYEYPEKSRRLSDMLKDMIQKEQEDLFLKETMMPALNDPTGDHKFTFQSEGDTVVLIRGDLPATVGGHTLTLESKNKPGEEVQLNRYRNGHVVSRDSAAEMRVTVEPQIAPYDAPDAPETDAGSGTEPQKETAAPGASENTRLGITIEGYDVTIESGLDMAEHKKFPAAKFSIPMSDNVRACEDHTIPYFVNYHGMDRDEQLQLTQQFKKLKNKLQSEIHSRASFSISCLVLVMVGCALGMMFRSGNFLSAFTVSFIPAMLSIALVVTGQQLCGNINLPVNVGLTFIWSGNILVLILAIVLLSRLQMR